MSAPLRDLLDDLVVHVPDVVGSPDLADRALATGRRRRTAARVRWVAAAAAVVLVALVAVPLGDRSLTNLAAGSERATKVTGYPKRIDIQWLVRDLPKRPGAIAAVIGLDDSKHSQDWFAVSPAGHRWRIPMTNLGGVEPAPSLSRDGRHLGYLARSEGPYVLHDLVTGRRTEIDDVRESPGGARFGLVTLQRSGVWSPDGRFLVLPAYLPGGGMGAVMLDASTGAASSVAVDRWPLQWRGDRISWLEFVDRNGSDEQDLAVVETDTSGRDIRRTVLASTTRDLSSAVDYGAFSWAMSSDGTTIAVRDWAAPGLQRFVASDGSLAGGPIQLGDPPRPMVGPCVMAYGAAPAVLESPEAADGDRGVLLTHRVEGDRLTTVSVVSPRLGPHCLIWADDALDGRAYGGSILGVSTARWTWWWRELLLGAAALVAAAAGVRRLLRLARRRRGKHYGAALGWYYS